MNTEYEKDLTTYIKDVENGDVDYKKELSKAIGKSIPFIIKKVKQVIGFLKMWRGIGYLLPIEQMKMDSLELVNELTQRGGVYSSEFVPKDLRQTRTRTIITKNGKLTSGVTRLKDWTHGEDVGINQLYLALLFFGMVICNAIGISGGSPIMNILSGGVLLLGASFTTLLLLALFVGFDAVKKILFYSLLIFVNYTIINLNVDSFIINIFTYGLPGLSILGLNYLLDRQMGFELKKQASEHSSTLGESFIRDGSNNPLVKQIKAGNLDKSPFIPLGIASGDFSAKGDPQAPEAGSQFGMTLADTSKHIIITGKTGVGKTTAARHIVYSIYASSIINNEKVGMFVTDGKQDLGLELKPLLHAVIDPNTHPNIIPHLGLDPMQFAENLAIANKAELGGNNGAFVSNPIDLAQNAYTAQLRLLEMKKLNLINDDEVKVSPSLKYILELAIWITTISSDVKEEHKLISILKNHPNLKTDDSITNLIQYIEVQQNPVGAEQRANLNSQFFTWMNKLTTNEEFFPWAKSEVNDFNVEDTLKGLRIALRFKKRSIAANAYTQFLKARIYNALSQRPSEEIWRADKTNTDVLFVSDECQNHLSEIDIDKAAQGRSQGIIMCFLSQNMKMVFTALKSTELVEAFFLNFNNYISLQTDDKTTDDFYENTVGQTRGNYVTAPKGNPIAFAETVDQMLRLPDFDPTHPDAHFIKFSKGVKVNKLKFGLKRGGLEDEVNAYRGFAEYTLNENNPLRPLYDASARKKLELGYAIVRVTRARIPRSDLVQLHGLTLKQLDIAVKHLHEEYNLD